MVMTFDDYKTPVHPTQGSVKISESGMIPYFKDLIDSQGYEVVRKDGRSMTSKDWKQVFRASNDSISYFLSLGYSVHLYRFGTFFWTYLGERTIVQQGSVSLFPARFAVRFRPAIGLKGIVSDVSDRYIPDTENK